MGVSNAMTVLKRLEGIAKRALAVVLGVLFTRPGRRARATRLLKAPRSILLVRPDNRVGEALLMTPLLEALSRLHPTPRVDILLHSKVKRVLEGHPGAHEVLALDRRALFLGPLAPGILPLRRRGYDVVVDCGNWEAPSVTAALVARLVGCAAAVIGPSQWPVGPLHDVTVTPLPDTRSEVAQRLHLLAPLGVNARISALSFRPVAASEAITAFERALPNRPRAIINPGGRLGWRCVPLPVFAAAAARVVEMGGIPVVTWGPGEGPPIEALAKACPGAVLAPATTLDELAFLMRRAALTVCNNTGPMHLSVALGTPTLGLFLHMDVARWGHAYGPHRMLDLTDVEASTDAMAAAVTGALAQMWRERVASAEEV